MSNSHPFALLVHPEDREELDRLLITSDESGRIDDLDEALGFALKMLKHQRPEMKEWTFQDTYVASYTVEAHTESQARALAAEEDAHSWLEFDKSELVSVAGGNMITSP